VTKSDIARAFRHLEPADIFDALETLGFRCNGRFLALNSYENRVYKVGLEDAADIVVKFYRPGRWSDEAILEEHDFARQLAGQEIPVVAPMEIDGETLFRTGSFRLTVYENRGGRAPELDDTNQLRQLGRFVARIHRVGETADFTARPSLNIESFGHQSREFLLAGEFIPDELRDVYASVAESVLDEVAAAYTRAMPVRELRLHGDLHPGNVLVAGEAFHIVDLDDARTGPAVQDLWMFLSGDRNEMTPQLAALLEGYQEFRRFDARELNLLEALRSLRIMHYAAWLARRWDDPAFRQAFPWFAARRYWDEHVLALREQVALMQEPPLEWRDY
jgi:Ser/Thr protein kinase RdoA (MazF antagonist)